MEKKKMPTNYRDVVRGMFKHDLELKRMGLEAQHQHEEAQREHEASEAQRQHEAEAEEASLKRKHNLAVLQMH